MNTSTQRNKKRNKRLAEMGVRRHTIYCHDSDFEEIKQFISVKNKERFGDGFYIRKNDGQ